MSIQLLLITGAIYWWVALDYLKQNRPGMAFAFLCYGLANCGFAFDSYFLK